jgi:hypothetical protein
MHNLNAVDAGEMLDGGLIRRLKSNSKLPSMGSDLRYKLGAMPNRSWRIAAIGGSYINAHVAKTNSSSRNMALPPTNP